MKVAVKFQVWRYIQYLLQL